MTQQQWHLLSSDQIQSALEAMRTYLAAPPNSAGQTPIEVQTEMDPRRTSLIDGELNPLVRGYIAGRMSLGEFKPNVHGINKRNKFWGFRGVKGQMFLTLGENCAE